MVHDTVKERKEDNRLETFPHFSFNTNMTKREQEYKNRKVNKFVLC